MGQSRKPAAAYWDEVRRTVAYADFLIRGGNPRGIEGRQLRHEAFGGPSVLLDAMHAELVHPKWRGQPHSNSKNRHRPRRETPSERRRRLAAEVLRQQGP